MNSTMYWGEIPEVSDTDSGIAALEREQITKPKPMEVEGHLLHQPSNRHHPPTNEVLSSDHFKMDPLVLHTIRLLQHIKKVRAAVEALQHDIHIKKVGAPIEALQHDIKSETEPTSINVGPIPEYDGPQITDRSHQKYFTEEEYQSDFVRGVPKPQPPIDDATCRKLLRRSTSAICAHLAIDTAPESVLDTLTDVCQEFFSQFTRHLGVAVDRRAVHGNDGFPDPIERVLHEMGVGSVTELHTFYQQRVVAYHSRMERKCQLLTAEYQQLVKQPHASTSTSSASSSSLKQQQVSSSPSMTGDTLQVIRIKEEPNTAIQFPLLDDKDDVAEAEQLLNIENLGPFEIVEHEIPTGLTTEMKAKGMQAKGADRDNRASKMSIWSSVDESSDNNPGSSHDTTVTTPQSSLPPATPQDIPPTPREAGDDGVGASGGGGGGGGGSIQDPGSISSSSEIFSPTLSTPSKPKKKKK